MAKNIKNLRKETLHVFVIDDSKYHNIILEKLLEVEGYTVQTFTNGLKLLNQLKNNKPHLIISDIEMPGMNGFELFNEIKKIPAAKEVPLLYISSNKKKRIVEQVETIGAAGFVQKPIIRDTFLKTVAKNCI